MELLVGVGALVLLGGAVWVLVGVGGVDGDWEWVLQVGGEQD